MPKDEARHGKRRRKNNLPEIIALREDEPVNKIIDVEEYYESNDLKNKKLTDEIIVLDSPLNTDSPSSSSRSFKKAAIPKENISKCPVCLDVIKLPGATLCGHIGCKACLIRACRSTAKCPVCRKPILSVVCNLRSEPLEISYPSHRFQKRDIFNFEKAPHITLPIAVGSEKFTLELLPQRGLISSLLFLNTKYEYLKGYVQGYPDPMSSVRLNVRHDNLLQGYIYFNYQNGTERTIHIDIRKSIDDIEQSYGFTNAQVLPNESSSSPLRCGNTNFNTAALERLPQIKNLKSGKLQDATKEFLTNDQKLLKIREMKNVPRATCKIAIYIDESAKQKLGNSAADNIISQLNQVDGIMEAQLNITLKLITFKEYKIKQKPSSLEDLLQSFANDLSKMENGDQDPLCASFLFTNMVFPQVGLAYQASSSNTFSGVCNAGNGRNSAVLLLNNNGVDLTMVESVAAWLHEIGHLGGALHDDEYPGMEGICSPEKGTFIMNPILNSSTSFSPCSVKSIRKVLLSSMSSCLFGSDLKQCSKINEGFKSCDVNYPETTGCSLLCRDKREANDVCFAIKGGEAQSLSLVPNLNDSRCR